MARIAPGAALSGIQAGDRWRAFRNLLAGLLIVAVWLSLWTWVAVGVLRPLSALTGGAAPRARAMAQRM